MESREAGNNQRTSAAKAGISERSARRIEKNQHQPKRGRPRDWRTREDPLAKVWESELRPMLEREPGLLPITLLEYLQKQHPGEYQRSVLRTLQRRVKQWRAVSGPPKEVMFSQEHRPGERGISDFTHFKQAEITIGGEVFPHLIYHYRLACSGWRYAQVMQGGESFAALSEGLQNALHRSGGVPNEHRTDSLSAAYRNLGGRETKTLSCNYEQLCQHYKLRPTRNNRGIAHENGSIESPHGHLKRRLHQALLLRGSCEFESIEAYQALLDEVVSSLNDLCHEAYLDERKQLNPLPAYRFADYEQLSVKVSRQSTILLRCMLYTVPSRLIGETVTLHLYQDRLRGFIAQHLVFELPRLYAKPEASTRRARRINYRHVIDSLRRKPRAFLNCTWREDLLPDDNYRRIWRQLQQSHDAYGACRLITEALYIAAKQDKEAAVATYLSEQLERQSLTLAGLQQQFLPKPLRSLPQLETQQHPLADYDQLLSDDSSQSTHDRPATSVAQVPASPSHAGAVSSA